jgi:hypothetical protein
MLGAAIGVLEDEGYDPEDSYSQGPFYLDNR